MRGVLMKKKVFEGCATALVTPFSGGAVDYGSFEALVERQLDAGVSALVFAGTTGEAPTLTAREWEEICAFAVGTFGGRVPVIVGCGSNSTAEAARKAGRAEELGADAALVVTPYYNKATQKGLIKMYSAIADASDKPVILYNVPSRTGVNIEPSTYLALSEHPMICGIKEANGNISKIVETFSLVGDKLDIYSGNDDPIVPILAMGGCGVISVLSDIMPAKTAEMCRLWFEGDHAGSIKLQCDLLPLINALFCEVNPIPVKAASAA
ncbi:MAG: 4-hydroxy-tetrahydrodipicolinate synthase, partial [Clostridia bacterium]|nr:4-hydroxy-tetrahydrodipicolinate synthase [Clostridia bacterium]